MQFVLKAPATMRLKLHYDKLPLTFAFNFNPHRYSKQWPKFREAQMVWKRAVAVLFSNEVRNELFKKFGRAQPNFNFEIYY